jgi:hypothetical protein
MDPDNSRLNAVGVGILTNVSANATGAFFRRTERAHDSPARLVSEIEKRRFAVALQDDVEVVGAAFAAPRD